MTQPPAPKNSTLPPVGSQLSVFGGKYKLDKDGDLILDCVRDSGYVAVEGGPADVASWRKKLDARGLIGAARHTGMSGLDDVKPMIQYMRTMGGQDICNSGLRQWEKRSLDDFKEAIAVLNRAGRQLRDEGIHLHYHNHDFEFKIVEGNKTGMDLLIEGLDFDVVDLCVDVAWVMRGGSDPAAFLLQHKDRIGYLHFKDFDGTDWAEMGHGKVDFHAIMKVLPQLTKVRWVMIEQDSTKIEPLDSARISREYLRKTFGY